jgi:hypothetical protein
LTATFRSATVGSTDPRRGAMRRFILIPAVLAALAVMPAAVFAQGAPDEQERFTDEFVDPDFCGTGTAVDVVEQTVFQIWGLEGEDTFKVTFRSRVAITYGDTTVYALSTGRIDVYRVEGEFPGPRTDHVAETGVRSMLRVPGQGVVTIDHGLLTYLASFDENGDFVDVEVLKDAGGHPDFFDPVWCEAATEALGIPTP